ncbi:acyl-CoA isoform X2 [Tasmannia lanceolata]|uniref:acyl-CoA isoform X2 n=1 Tax=Tasmannia lanceolata TaxID=3420 RepID=UPI0040629FF1
MLVRKHLYKVSLVLWGLAFLLNFWIIHGDSYRGGADGSEVEVGESNWQEVVAEPNKESYGGNELSSKDIDSNYDNQDTTITNCETTISGSEFIVNEETKVNSSPAAKEQTEVGSATTPLGAKAEKETQKIDLLSRGAPPGLDEFKNKAIHSKGRTITGHSGTIIHKMEPDGRVYNYASATKGAKVLAFNKEANGASNILHKNKDKYLRNPCSAKDKFVVIELSEETLVDTIEIASFEYYSSSLKGLELLSSLAYPTDSWVKLGNFTAGSGKHKQRFTLPEPKWTRYLKLNLLSHYGTEFYCTLSVVEVYGVDAVEQMLEDLISVQDSLYLYEETHAEPIRIPVKLVPSDGDDLYRKLLTETEFDSGLEGLSSIREFPKNSVPDPVMEKWPQHIGRMPGDSVLKILMLKFESLDLSLSVLEHYLEELNTRYVNIFKEFDDEMDVKELLLEQIKLQIKNLVDGQEVFAKDIGELVLWKSIVSSQVDTLVRDDAILRSEVETVRHDQVEMENKGVVVIFGKLPSGHSFRSSSPSLKISALFWGHGKTVEPHEMDISLGAFTLTGSAPEGVSTNEMKPQKIFLSVVSSISEISPQDWDACALDASGLEKLNPFVTHAFLSSLEESGCAVKETGWLPRHVVAQDEYKNIIGVVPLYLKSHSYGEFVFDHSWADAYYNYGSKYYPKLQCCVPFTPVTGQRILLRNTWYRDQVFVKLVSALKELTAKVSSLHITFPSELEWHKMKEEGFLQRIGMQYHWKNRNYKNFDEFLMDMKQNKRKNIRQERKKISAQNLTMKRLRGDEIKAKHWDSFYEFYRNTTDNKWGRAFLTRDFFHNMGSKMGDQLLLVIAEDGDELVAGALNLIGGDTLYGRLWGCLPRAYYPSLHFEACYYQAIEAAIELNLHKVEAGAQGEHKIQRGYLPVTTYSCHYILDDAFQKAIGEFLVRETDQVKVVMKLLHDSGPLKEGIQ